MSVLGNIVLGDGIGTLSDCWGTFDFSTSIIVIIISCVLGIAWAAFNFLLVRKINVMEGDSSSRSNLVENISEEQRKLLIELGDKIANVSVH